MKKLVLFFVGLMSIFCSIQAFGQFTLTSEFRPRFEYRNGFQKLPDATTESAFFVSERLRLGLNYKNENITTQITFQEVRVWGDEMLKSKSPTIGLFEGWLEFKLCDSLSVRVGRQGLAYDNERFMSYNNWRQTEQAHDAVVLKWKYKGLRVDFGSAFNQSAENQFGTDYDNTKVEIKDNYKSMNYLWLSKEFGKFKCSSLVIADGFQKAGTKTTNYLRLTYGVNLYYKVNNLTLAGRAYMQSGKTPLGKDIKSWYVNPEIIYVLNKKFSFNPGVEVFSGKDYKDLNDDNYRCFVPAYGTNHSFNGHMEYFSDKAKSTKEAGLVDIYLRFNYKVNEKVNLRADYHHFSLQNNYVYTVGLEKITAKKPLGDEIDLNVRYDVNKDVSMLAGWSFMFAKESLAVVQGGNEKRVGQWAFVMLTVKPTLFTTAK